MFYLNRSIFALPEVISGKVQLKLSFLQLWMHRFDDLLAYRTEESRNIKLDRVKETRPSVVGSTKKVLLNHRFHIFIIYFFIYL